MALNRFWFLANTSEIESGGPDQPGNPGGGRGGKNRGGKGRGPFNPGRGAGLGRGGGGGGAPPAISSATNELYVVGKNGTTTLVADAWTRLPFDTTVANNITGVTVDNTNHELDFPAGATTYRVLVIGQFRNTEEAQIRIRNVTGGSNLAVSCSLLSNNRSPSFVRAVYRGALNNISIGVDYYVDLAGTQGVAPPGSEAAGATFQIYVEAL